MLVEDHDVLIVGAGPAGIFSALRLYGGNPNFDIALADKGHSIAGRFCPALSGQCVHCSVCHLVSGFGGAGLFSDGKIILDLNVGGHLRDYDSDNLLRPRLQADVLQFFESAEFGLPSVTRAPPPPALVLMRASELGLKVKNYPVLHIGTEGLRRFLTTVEQRLSSSGCALHFQHEAEEIQHSDGLWRVVFRTKSGHRVIRARDLILAVGKEGSWWLSSTLRHLGVPIGNNRIYVGVRVEVSLQQAEQLFDWFGPDPKISYQFQDGTKIKTHCACKAGQAIPVRYFGYAIVGGHSPAASMAGQGGLNATFAILLRAPSPDSFSPENALQLLARTRSLTADTLLIQRWGDFEAGIATTAATLGSSSLSPSMPYNISPGNIREIILPFQFDSKLLHFANLLNQVVPGLIEENAIIYAPAMEWWMPRVDVNSVMRTNLTGLYTIGDGAGLSQGVAQAAATGILAAEDILSRK